MQLGLGLFLVQLLATFFPPEKEDSWWVTKSRAALSEIPVLVFNHRGCRSFTSRLSRALAVQDRSIVPDEATAVFDQHCLMLLDFWQAEDLWLRNCVVDVAVYNKEEQIL